MGFKVLLTHAATRDLEDIDDYISAYDSPENADYVLNKVEEVILGLAELPSRGSCPKELSALGMKEYREVFFKPYRVIYRVLGKNVYVYVIADGRRDMQTLLATRLLGA